MPRKENWEKVQREIDACRLCEQVNVNYLQVPSKEKCHPTWPPKRETKILFVSVAPPWGGDYFWDESKADKVRDGLLRAINKATGDEITSTRSFLERGYYLVPAVKCPSQRDGRDRQPSAAAIQNCKQFLLREIAAVSPRSIVALGRKPLRALTEIFSLTVPSTIASCERKTWIKDGYTLAATYFPGNNRHRKYCSIVDTIRNLL